MSKGLRRFLFYTSILAFLAGGTLTAFYALGWRIDFETLEPQKVGAIYLRSFPPEAAITLDGEPVKNKTGFFQAGTLINRLYPKTYSLRLSYPEFRDWKRSVEVKPALVSEVKYAVLIPKETTRVLTEKVRDFWLIDEEPLVKDDKGRLVLQDQILSGTDVVGWTTDFTRLLARDGKTGAYHWNDLRNATSSNVTAMIRRVVPRFPTSTEIQVDAENTTQLLLHDSSTLSLFDLQRNALVPIAAPVAPTSTATTTKQQAAARRPVITDAAISRFWIGWSEFVPASGTSRIHLYDKFFGTRRELEPLPGRTVEMKWANNVLGFFQDDGKFYYVPPGADRPQHLADDVTYFEFSPGGDMVATLGGQNLEVFNLRDRSRERKNYWRYDGIPEPKRISKLTWFRDGQHIFISYPGTTVFLELDDLGLENLATLAQSDRVHYQPDTNEFYFIETGALMRLAFPE